MKKQNLKSLTLKKNTISSFNTSKIGGGDIGDDLQAAAASAAGKLTICATCDSFCDSCRSICSLLFCTL